MTDEVDLTLKQIAVLRAQLQGANDRLAGTATTGRIDSSSTELRFGFKYRFQ